MSETKYEKTKIRQLPRWKEVSGLVFTPTERGWVSNIGPVRLTLDKYGYKCTTTDTRDGYFSGFKTVTAAKAFAKRRKHGRTIIDHKRAECLKARQEWKGLSLKEFADHLDLSPRTIEAYYSGARAVPEII